MLACPYCYRAFREREIAFRCTGRVGPRGRRCPRARDDILASQTGKGIALPPAFSAKGSQLRATCPQCGGETSYRLCPHCHSQLPVHFGKVNSRLIALIGAKESGKTVYMTVLLHELINRVGQRFGASVVGSDDDTRAHFDRDYERRLYTERALPAATASAGASAGRRIPLVFRFSLERKRLLRDKLEHSILSFFDTAGEDLVTQSSVDFNARYLASADGIILLLDPLQMDSHSAAVSGPRPNTGDSATPLNVLTRVTDLLHTAGDQKPSARIDKPIAVAISKLDALWHTFPEGSALRRPHANGPAFNIRDSLDVHAYVQALLHEWDGGRIDQILQHNYRKYRYFGLSALGEPPTADRRVAERGVRPYRVQDPFLWLLHEFGTIPGIEG